MVDRPSTAELLSRWCAGDRSALATVIVSELAWLRAVVHRQIGATLRRGGDTDDYTNRIVVSLLEHAPKGDVVDRAHLRALLLSATNNNLCDAFDALTADRRDVRRERPIPPSSVEPAPASLAPRPSEAAARHEEHSWLEIGIALLLPEDRRVILMRDFHDRSFKEIGDALGVGEDAARMRYNRALPRLAAVLGRMRERGAGPTGLGERAP